MKIDNKNILISMNIFGFEMLKVLLKCGIKVSTVYTIKKDRSKTISDYQDFSELAKRHKINIKYVSNINKHTSEIKRENPDYIFVFGWSQILKKELLKIPKYGCIGSHPALLPKNRGRAAIPWHFINNEKFGGTTMFFINEGCDSGDIIAQKKFLITNNDNAKTYYEKDIKLGKQIIRENAANFLSNKLKIIKQDEDMATYLLIRTEKNSFLDFFKMTAKQIFNQIRAVAYIYPTAFAYYENKKIFIYKSRVIPKREHIYSATPGQIIKVFDNAIWVKIIDGIIEFKNISNSHNKKINVKNYFKVGNHFNK